MRIMENLSQRELNLQKYIKSDEELRKEEKKQRIMNVVRKIAVYFFLIVVAIIIVFPFYWMVASSLKSKTEYYLNPPTFFPYIIEWENYGEAWNSADFGGYMINTILVGITSTFLSMFVLDMLQKKLKWIDPCSPTAVGSRCSRSQVSAK